MKKLLFLAILCTSVFFVKAQNTFPASGNVGIGTINPTTRLNIRSGINQMPANSGNTQPGGALRIEGGDNAVIDFGTNSINTWIQATDKTSLDYNYNLNFNPNGGNVGIGIINPTATLQVNTLGSNRNDGGLARFLQPQLNDGNDNSFVFGKATGTNQAGIIGFLYQSSDSVIGINHWGDNTGLYIKKGGNVGVGILTPGGKLTTRSNINTLPATSGSQQNGSALRVEGGDNAVIDFGTNSINTWIQATDKTDLQYKYNLNLNPVGGNVGIGTTNPDQKLSVAGTIHSQAVKVDMTGWSDYVFKPAYNLSPLENVKTYIDKNHLPDMPTENEVVKNGINVGEMLKLQQKKIEELTLYLIEIKKENSALNKRVAKLEKSR